MSGERPQERADENSQVVGQTGSRRRKLGLAGENYAAKLLAEAHLTVLVRNYRCPRGEIDLIARDGEKIVFVEVRGRSSGRQGWGEESVTRAKQRRLRTVASHYLLAQGYREFPPLRFDVLALRWKASESEPEVNWLKGVF